MPPSPFGERGYNKNRSFTRKRLEAQWAEPMTNMTGSKLSIFPHPGKITGYWITTISFPYRGPYWPGPIWASTSTQANMGVSFLDVGSM